MRTLGIPVFVVLGLSACGGGPEFGISIMGLDNGTKAIAVRFHEPGARCDLVLQQGNAAAVRAEARKFAKVAGKGGCLKTSGGEAIFVDNIKSDDYVVSATTFGPPTDNIPDTCDDYVNNGVPLDFGCAPVTITQGERADIPITVQSLPQQK
ncbi:MAG: hypothetical protein U1E65_13540 [Myxococcota bacterium]